MALFCPEAQAAGASELPRALQSPLAGEPQTRLPAQNPPRCPPVCSGITLPTPRRSLGSRRPDSWVPRPGCMPPAVPTSRCRAYGRVGPAPSPPEGLPFLDPRAAPTGSPHGLAPLAASWSPLSSEGSLWNVVGLHGSAQNPLGFLSGQAEQGLPTRAVRRRAGYFLPPRRRFGLGAALPSPSMPWLVPGPPPCRPHCPALLPVRAGSRCRVLGPHRVLTVRRGVGVPSLVGCRPRGGGSWAGSLRRPLHTLALVQL